MQRSLNEHIASLETEIVILRRQLRDDNLSDYQKSESELALKNAEEALRLFLKAYDLEQSRSKRL